MIADVAFVLALGWWATLIYVLVALKRALRDPDLVVKLMRKMSSASKRPTAASE